MKWPIRAEASFRSTPRRKRITFDHSANRTRRDFGLPHPIRVDQGCQFASKELDLWAYTNRITLDFSGPGKPTVGFPALSRVLSSKNHSTRDLCAELLQSWTRKERRYWLRTAPKQHRSAASSVGRSRRPIPVVGQKYAERQAQLLAASCVRRDIVLIS